MAFQVTIAGCAFSSSAPVFYGTIQKRLLHRGLRCTNQKNANFKQGYFLLGIRIPFTTVTQFQNKSLFEGGLDEGKELETYLTGKSSAKERQDKIEWQCKEIFAALLLSTFISLPAYATAPYYATENCAVVTEQSRHFEEYSYFCNLGCVQTSEPSPTFTSRWKGTSTKDLSLKFSAPLSHASPLLTISTASSHESPSAPNLSHQKVAVGSDNSDCPMDSDVNLVQNNYIHSSADAVTNESVIEEAWDVVNENFLDARHHNWSAAAWQEKKEEVLKKPIRSRMAAYGAINNMLASLKDPYTRFLTPDQFAQLSKYDLTGIGLNIGEAEDANGNKILRVLGMVLGSPAQSVGVQQGDELLSVDGHSVHGLSAFEAASLIQGPKGTPVSVQIRHGHCGEVHSFRVERQQDVHTPVFYRLERTKDSDQLRGYIRLREFNALAKRDLVTAMQRLQDGGATSFLLDLQDNPGGLVQAGIEIAKIFLDSGETVIETVGRDPSIHKSILVTGFPLTKAPLMVLVNDHTASASEIVAAALHDNCRAILVGSRTFGKGLIQSVYELSDGSGLVLTVGKYVTAGHHDIDGNGIEPDFKSVPGLLEASQKLGSCLLGTN